MAGMTYHLQMFSPPDQVVPPPRGELEIVHAQKPTLDYYRFLYETIGKDYNWTSRLKMPVAELSDILNHPLNEVHVLMVQGSPGGLAELDRRVNNEIEITQFGLMPENIGQGLGKFFLNWALHRAWSYSPKRVWLHTCTNDHPRALGNYQKAGLAIFKEVPRL